MFTTRPAAAVRRAAERILSRAAGALAEMGRAVFVGRGGLYLADGGDEDATCLIREDASPCFLTRDDGVVCYANKAALRAYGPAGETDLAQMLEPVLTRPGEVLRGLAQTARAGGSACEEILTATGHLCLNVHRAGEGRLLWRVERSAKPRQGRTLQDRQPVLTLGRDDTIIHMNAAARTLIGSRPGTLDAICPRPPLRTGQLNEIRTWNGPVRCLAVELEGAGDHREICLLTGVAPVAGPANIWTVFDSLPVPLLKLAGNGEIRLSNRPARDLLGVTDCSGLVLGDLMEGLGRPVADWLSDAAAGRGTVHSEFLRLRREDKEVFVHVTLNRAVDDGETHLIAVLCDATEFKLLEAQFVQSQKMQAIGQLAGGVAHDFNNLLTAISGHCDLLLLRHRQGDADYADLVQINQNASRAAALVGQLLAFSRKQALRPEVMDLRDLLSDLTHLLNRLVGERVTLSLGHDPRLWAIRADRRQLEQVFMNLVVNARDAMPGGGEIRIETRNLDLESPLHRDRAVVAPGRYVQVKVSDAGIGIKADKLQKIFEPFYTTKRTGEGTGLGLSTAYGIIKQTGGFIFADSQPGEGTDFILLLPAHQMVAKPAAPEQRIARRAGTAHRPPRQARQGRGSVGRGRDIGPGFRQPGAATVRSDGA